MDAAQRRRERTKDLDVVMLSYAHARHGVVSRRELLDLGYSQRAVSRRVEDGVLIPVHRSIYRLSAIPDFWMGRTYAACRSLEPHVVASHRSAAAIWELGDQRPRRVEVSIFGGGRRASGLIVHRVKDMPPGDRRIRELIPVTSPTRTVIDCCAVLGDRAAEAIIDDACHQRLTTPERLMQRIDELSSRGRNGVARARRLVQKCIDEVERPESRLTRKLLNLIQASHLPNPVSLFPIRLPNGVTLHPDLAYPAFMIAIEAESYKHHGDWEGQRRDMQRTNILQALGWMVLRFTWEDVTTRPDYVVTRVEHALRHRGAFV